MCFCLHHVTKTRRSAFTCRVTLPLYLTLAAASVETPHSDHPRWNINIKPMHAVARCISSRPFNVCGGLFLLFFLKCTHTIPPLLTYISFEKTAAKCIFRMNNGNKKRDASTFFARGPHRTSRRSSSLMLLVLLKAFPPRVQRGGRPEPEQKVIFLREAKRRQIMNNSLHWGATF